MKPCWHCNGTGTVTVNTYPIDCPACAEREESRLKILSLRNECDGYRYLADHKMALRREIEETLGMDPGQPANDATLKVGLNRLRKMKAAADHMKACRALLNVDSNDVLFDAIEELQEQLSKARSIVDRQSDENPALRIRNSRVDLLRPECKTERILQPTMPAMRTAAKLGHCRKMGEGY